MSPTQTNVDCLNSTQLAGYLERIHHHTTDLQPDYATLASITKAHLSHIPYENLDLHYQIPDGPQPVCSIRLPATYDKMVLRKRGGYCLEVNALLAQALRAVGFLVETSVARHVFDASRLHEVQDTSPRDLASVWPTHLCLLVTTQDQKEYLVDVGLSKFSLAEPLPLPTTDNVSAAVTRGILGKQFRLRSTADSPGASDGDARGYYLQVSIPHSKTAEITASSWRDFLFFQTKPAGVETEEYIHTWMSKGPHAVSPQYPFATMPVEHVGQVSVQDDELVIRVSERASKDGYLFLWPGAATTVTKQTLAGPQAVAQAMARYFGIPASYMASPRARVAVEEASWN